MTFIVFAEQAFQYQFEREVAHLLGDVERTAGLGDFAPCLPSLLGAVDHLVDQAMNVLAGKRRLDHPPRAPPGVTVADDQAVAEQHLDALKARTLLVLAMPAHQQAADFVGIVDEIGPPAVGPGDRNDVTIIRFQGRKRRERLRIDLQRLRRIRTRWLGLVGVRQAHD